MGGDGMMGEEGFFKTQSLLTSPDLFLHFWPQIPLQLYKICFRQTTFSLFPDHSLVESSTSLHLPNDYYLSKFAPESLFLLKFTDSLAPLLESTLHSQ